MRTITLLFALLCLAVAAQSTSAQLYGYNHYSDPQQASMRPTVSPYLNLLNQSTNVDGTPRFNAIYQTMVRPQIEQREQQNVQSREMFHSQANFQRFHSQIGLPSNAGSPRTGHGASFMSYSHYYNYNQPHPPSAIAR